RPCVVPCRTGTGRNSACSDSVIAGDCGMPDEPPDAWPACPVVWEGGGRPAPLPDGGVNGLAGVEGPPPTSPRAAGGGRFRSRGEVGRGALTAWLGSKAPHLLPPAPPWEDDFNLSIRPVRLRAWGSARRPNGHRPGGG